MQKSSWFWVMDAIRGYIFLSSNYQKIKYNTKSHNLGFTYFPAATFQNLILMMLQLSLRYSLRNYPVGINVMPL